jgi:transcriptional regulator with XRE-family HTH domain
MPRPSKRVSPDTLGGRIRAARQNLRLSLAEVAGERYSTSLISQIERNRVDPSQESLGYLAERLKLPIEDLMALAQQHRESEAEVTRYKVYDEQRMQAQQALANNRSHEALQSLEGIDLAELPSHMRWRLAALRGQAHFNLREFRQAQHDFLYAFAEKPPIVPSDQALEAMMLALHLAAASRELGQVDDAAKYYEVALGMMDASTSLRYIAEAHWGMALVSFEQARRIADEAERTFVQGPEVEVALKHAESARILYQSIGDQLRAAALTCEIGLIEQAAGNLDRARVSLREVFDTWKQKLDEVVETTAAGKRRRQERANVVSAAACYLAGVELDAGNYDVALTYVEQAQEAGKESYTLRRAEAAMMLGRILEAQSREHPECDGQASEAAFRQAVSELDKTDRIAAKIKAMDLLGRHLLKKGKTDEGEKVLDRARRLSQFGPTESAITPENDTTS